MLKEGFGLAWKSRFDHRFRHYWDAIRASGQPRSDHGDAHLFTQGFVIGCTENDVGIGGCKGADGIHRQLGFFQFQ